MSSPALSVSCFRSPRLPSDEHEIVLHNDGTWDPLPPKLEELTPLTTPAKSDVKTEGNEEIIILDSDSDEADEEEDVSLPPRKRIRLSGNSSSSPDIICLDDDD